MRISDWSSDVCSSDLCAKRSPCARCEHGKACHRRPPRCLGLGLLGGNPLYFFSRWEARMPSIASSIVSKLLRTPGKRRPTKSPRQEKLRSEEHTSELQSLMRISYTAFRLYKKKKNKPTTE